MNKSIDELNKMISTGNIELYTKDYVNELQQRIDKAIEYILQGDWHENDVYLGDDILSILRGEDNE